MPRDWNELTKITQGADIIIERVRFSDTGIAIEGEFELPQLARISAEDQIFIMAFIQCHGSIKDMEQMFGVSYPTVKNRLNRLAGRLELIEKQPFSSSEDVISELERGEIDADEAIRRLTK